MCEFRTSKHMSTLSRNVCMFDRPDCGAKFHVSGQGVCFLLGGGGLDVFECSCFSQNVHVLARSVEIFTARPGAGRSKTYMCGAKHYALLGESEIPIFGPKSFPQDPMQQNTAKLVGGPQPNKTNAGDHESGFGKRLCRGQVPRKLKAPM